MASSIARTTRLEYLSQSPKEPLENIMCSYAFQWHGVESKAFAEMLLDSCKRVYCQLIMCDHDAERAASNISGLSSTIDIQINYSSLREIVGLNKAVFPDSSILTEACRLSHCNKVLILHWEQKTSSNLLLHKSRWWNCFAYAIAFWYFHNINADNSSCNPSLHNSL